MTSNAKPENLSVADLADAIANNTFKIRGFVDFNHSGNDISIQFVEKTDNNSTKKEDYVRGLVVGIDWTNREVRFVSDPHLEKPEHLDAYIKSAKNDPSNLRGYVKHLR